MTRLEATANLLERFRFLAPRRWNGLVCVTYHRIGDPADSPFDRETWSATEEEFDRQVRFLRAHFDVVHPADLLDLQRRGRGRHALISFDDGSRDGHDLALPILRAHGVPATFFVTTGFLDLKGVAWWDEVAWMVANSLRPGLPPSRWTDGPIALTGNRDLAVLRLLRCFKEMPSSETGAYLAWLGETTGSGRCPVDEESSHWMTWDDVRALRDAGMAIGGHTVSHPILSRMDRAGQHAEITDCALRIREELGEPMRWFAYPVGGARTFDATTRALLAASGVELAFSDYGGHRLYADWDPLDVRRIAVETYMAGRYFRSMLMWPALIAPPRPPTWRFRVRETLRGWTGSRGG